MAIYAGLVSMVIDYCFNYTKRIRADAVQFKIGMWFMERLLRYFGEASAFERIYLRIIRIHNYTLLVSYLNFNTTLLLPYLSRI